MRPTFSFAIVSCAFVVAACKGAPKELEPPTPPATSTTQTFGAAGQKSAHSAQGSASGSAPYLPPSSNPVANGDPNKGEFSLAEATKDLKGTGPLVAKIETSKGAVQCRLYSDKAPVTVANFIGLATGKRAWKTQDGQWVNKPAYDGTTFHRIIKGFMIQGGDAQGTGAGEPGYVIKDEIWEGAKHDRAGLLCMANRGPNTNGAQFFITDASAPHLDGGYTIFGECAPVSVVHDIASVPTGPMDRPISPVTIKSVTISREEAKK